ncbi:hypothetical protein Avbf_02147 [Armadillidium vulgare]|nr:hypothetical protein Avbf_02147 [Armadillidium vulgare]
MEFWSPEKVIKKFLNNYQSEPQILDPDHPLHKSCVDNRLLRTVF